MKVAINGRKAYNMDGKRQAKRFKDIVGINKIPNNRFSDSPFNERPTNATSI